MRTLKCSFGFLVVLLLATASCFATDFNKRLEQADAILKTKKNAARSDWIFEHVGKRTDPILRKCLSSVEHPDVTGFILIGDVVKSGNVINIRVRPATNVARCLEDGIRDTVFDSPPLQDKEQSLPLVLDSVHVVR